MKITVEFASLNEFKQYMGVESPNLLAQASKETEDAPAPAEAVQEPQKAPEGPAPKKNTKKVEKTAPAEAEPAPESADDAAPAEVTEDFRITVRKQLAALNKKRGYNRAAELINEQTGKGKLTEVALADLPKLMEAAKEETNAD
jgi:hypothetical protein